MKATFVLLMLCAAPAAAAAGPETRTVRLLYAADLDLSSGMDLLGPLEEAVSSGTPRVQIEGVETLKAHFSQGTFAFQLPEGAGAFAASEVPAIDTPKESLFLFATGYPLLDQVAANATRLGGDAPGARLRPARLIRAKLPGGALGWAVGFSTGAPAGWRATLALAYHLRIEGRPVTVVVAGKPRGGADRIRAFLRRRAAELRDPYVQFSAGFVTLPPEFPVAPDVLIKGAKESGDRFIAFSDFDVEYGWETVLDFGRRTPEQGGVPLLATNLKAAAAAPVAIERTHIEEVQGLRIGFLSVLPTRSRAFLERRKTLYEIEEPAAAARDAVKELRKHARVDLVVAVSHLSAEENARFLDEVDGIDVFLEGRDRYIASGRRVTVDLTRWNQEDHSHPALLARAPMHSFNELAVTFHRTGGRTELERIEELPGPTDNLLPGGEDSELEDKMLDFFVRPVDALLPDPRGLWPGLHPPKLTYWPTEFWNLAAQLVRRETKAEVSLLRIHWLQSNTPGKLTENFVRQWVDRSGRVVTVKLPGTALKALLKRCPFEPVPMTEEPVGARYETDISLAAAGIDKKGRVSGVPITDSELYSVATTEDLLAKIEELPELREAQDPKPEERMLGDMVIDALKAQLKGPDTDGRLREAFEGKTPFGPVWRLNLREASLQVANTQVAGNGTLGSVPDARIQSVSQVVVQGTARLFSELYWGKLRWDAGVSADYGKVTLKPSGAASIVNVTRDKLSVETELRHRTRYVESGKFSLGPFVGLSYATQFTKPPGTPRAQAFTVKAGVKLFDGPHLKELYVAPLVSKDYSLPEPHAQSGYSAGLKWDSALYGTPIYLRGQIDYVEYFKETYDTPADLKRTLDATIKMSVPFYAGLRLSPFMSYYLFEGKLPDRTGFNILFGVSLEFSRLWKPLF